MNWFVKMSNDNAELRTENAGLRKHLERCQEEITTTAKATGKLIHKLNLDIERLQQLLGDGRAHLHFLISVVMASKDIKPEHRQQAQQIADTFFNQLEEAEVREPHHD